MNDAADVIRVPEDLLKRAKQAWQNAYVPYSGFKVGAALRAESGQIYAGANVENSSYGLTRCAEQSAVQAMASAGERRFLEMVVYTASGPAASPCGACRQVLLEFAEGARVYMVGKTGTVHVLTVEELLPHGFKLSEHRS